MFCGCSFIFSIQKQRRLYSSMSVCFFKGGFVLIMTGCLKLYILLDLPFAFTAKLWFVSIIQTVNVMLLLVCYDCFYVCFTLICMQLCGRLVLVAHVEDFEYLNLNFISDVNCIHWLMALTLNVSTLSVSFCHCACDTTLLQRQMSALQGLRYNVSYRPEVRKTENLLTNTRWRVCYC